MLIDSVIIQQVSSLYETKNMSSLALEQLSITLKTSASEIQELSSLSDAHLLQLNSLIEKAQQTQRKTLSDAIDNAMSFRVITYSCDENCARLRSQINE